VFAVSLWLGKTGNAGRAVSPATLFAELQNIYLETGQSFPYKSPSAFGKHISKEESALGFIGLSFHPTQGGRDYQFQPSPAELETCKALYTDLCAANTADAHPPRDYSRSCSPMPNGGGGNVVQDLLQ